MGSLESFLLLRSLRTLHLRAPAQAKSGTIFAKWLAAIIANAPTKGTSWDGVEGGVIESVTHAALQARDANGWHPLDGQMIDGPACFCFRTTEEYYARYLPHSLEYFVVSRCVHPVSGAEN